MTNKEKQKGVALYLIVIIMAVLLAIVLGLSTIIVGGLEVTSGVGKSIGAFYVADTGIENALYRVRVLANCDNFSGSLEEGSYEIIIVPPAGGTCLDGGTKITSLGEYKGSKKRIEVSY